MSIKKIIAAIICLTLVMVLFAGCGDTAGQSSGGQIVYIGTQEMPNSEGIAKSLGYLGEVFGEAGWDVEILSFSSGAKVNAALLSGDIDFGLIGTCPVSNGLSSGIGYKVIWIHEILGSAESLAVRSAVDASGVGELAGKTIATPFASTAHYSVIKALENAGLAETDVDLIDMQPAEIFAAWGRGDIDAAYVWEPTLSQLLSEGNIVLTSEDMADMGAMTADLEVVRTEFAQEHPELVQIYLECLDRAVKLHNEDKPAAVAAIASGLEISEKDAEYQMDGYRWLTAEEQYDEYFASGELARTLFSTAEFLLEQGSITRVPGQEEFDAAVDTAAMGKYLGK